MQDWSKKQSSPVRFAMDWTSKLQAASNEGEEAIVKLLLENGADVNAKGGVFWIALHAASQRGEEAIVKLLLENGAEVNAEGGQYENALQASGKHQVA